MDLHVDAMVTKLDLSLVARETVEPAVEKLTDKFKI